MQMSKKVTKGGGITIPRMLRQETGILPGSQWMLTADEAGIHIAKHVPACRFCGTVEDVAAVCGMEVCRNLCREDCGGVPVTEKTKEIKARADRLVELTAQKRADPGGDGGNQGVV
ncbi:MAG: AbrB/MazE/SpoVT family DNA-binding domain-containing protein [Enterocloster bolteae]